MPPKGSLAESAAAIRGGSVSPLELVDRCLANINRDESRIHAWVLVDRGGARQAARQLADELHAGGWRGPLHGIPIGVKDIVDVAGWPTLAGSPLRAGHVASEDATVVAKLRAAGAILLGKTVTTEFACFDPPPTRNPWNTAHTPGGSSSGSAAAVALGMCLGAIGSQTGGSITRPATYCGVAGCKPTFGRVSRHGVLPVTEHLDHVGPIARTVTDLAILLVAMARPDPRDPATLDQPPLGQLVTDDDGQLCLPRRRRPPLLGYLHGMDEKWGDGDVRRATLSAVERLISAGASVEQVDLPGGFETVHADHRAVMAVEAARCHAEAFAAHRESYGPMLRGLLDEGLSISPARYQAALVRQREFRASISAQLARFDALVTPATTSPARPSLNTTGDPAMNSPWSFAGLPTVSIPCGFSSGGMPLGLQLVGGPFREVDLLCVAAWCEETLAVDCRIAAR